jgi:hypothetical protein
VIKIVKDRDKERERNNSKNKGAMANAAKQNGKDRPLGIYQLP